MLDSRAGLCSIRYPVIYPSLQFSKKRSSSLARRSTQLFQRTPFDLRGYFRNFLHVSRLATFAAIRHRGKIRAIRLQHELVEWRRGECVADVLTVLEREDAGEAHNGIQRHNALHGHGVFRKAMELATHAIGERRELRE